MTQLRLALILLFVIPLHAQKSFNSLKDYYQSKNWSYPIQFETGKKVVFSQLCHGTYNLPKDSSFVTIDKKRLAKNVDQKRWLSLMDDLNTQMKEYVSYVMASDSNLEGFVVSAPMICVRPVADAYVYDKDVYYAIFIRKLHISLDGKKPCEDCFLREKNIYQSHEITLLTMQEENGKFDGTMGYTVRE
jgi:hypothetical protein